MITFFLTGQMIALLVLDHYGLIGFPIIELSEWRIPGVILVVNGAYVFTRYRRI